MNSLKTSHRITGLVLVALLGIFLLSGGVFALLMTQTSKASETHAAHEVQTGHQASPLYVPQLQSSYSTPSWWSGNCNANGTNGGYPGANILKDKTTGILAVWRGIEACGPRPLPVSKGGDGGQDVGVKFPLLHAEDTQTIENEWECTELVKRYLYLAYGLDSLAADGGSLVSIYTAHQYPANPNPFYNHSIVNDGSTHMFPVEGDVISGNDHTAIVSNVVITDSSKGNATVTLFEQNYDQTGFRPISMSNWKMNGGVFDWMTTRQVTQVPGGVWNSSTPSDGSLELPSSWVQVSAHAFDNSGLGLSKIQITESIEGTNSWGVVKTVYSPGVVTDVIASVFMPTIQNVLVSFDVYSNDGLKNLAPNGIRRFCPGSPCTPYNTNNGNGGGGGSGNPTPTPPPTDGFVICQNTNYGNPCETFHYTSHDTCISLDQMAGHNKSVEYIGDYVNGYSAVMYHDNNCGTYLARYDNNNPDIGWGLYDQFSSMRLEQHMPPDATQVSPINGATLPLGTTETDVSFSGTAPFTLHVWDLTTHYDLWQGNISTTIFHLTGLQSGAIYTWQIIGNTGPWSTQWTFNVASSQATPTPTSTSPPVSNTPQGVWVNQGSSCAWQPNTSCTLTLQVTSDVPLTSVNILAEWNQTWYTLCKDTQPNSGTVDQYNCTITDWHTTDNFNYPPNGPIRFRADAYDTSGNVTYYVGGDFWITFGQ